jgi:NhaB family Na+:H+ antiporter
MAPISMPVLAAGLITCVLLEKFKLFGYGVKLPRPVLQVLKEFADAERAKRTQSQKVALIVQAVAAAILVVGLALHLAEVGLIGLLVIILITSFNGVTDEHQIGKAFQEALPFTSLLVVFFAIVAVIHEQHLFSPIIAAVLALPPEQQPGMFFLANGVLSMISDNVFVATVYISEIKQALDNGAISREHFDRLAVAINTGTNLPSVATPNGQAAFLFLLTSAIAPLVRLSYGRMVIMALPYTVVLGGVGLLSVMLFIKA